MEGTINYLQAENEKLLADLRQQENHQFELIDRLSQEKENSALKKRESESEIQRLDEKIAYLQKEKGGIESQAKILLQENEELSKNILQKRKELELARE